MAAFASDWYKETLVDIGALEFALDVLYCVKLMVDTLDRLGIFEQWKLRRKELPTKDVTNLEEVKEEEVVKKIESHPFAGYLSKIVSLACSLTYRANTRVENYFMSQQGKLRLGAILSHTKMDVDNPMLREWCLVTIRNLCSWSAAVREDLQKLKLIEVSEEGKKSLEDLGVKELFEREINKLKKRDATGNLVYENHNIHFDTVDF